MAASVPIMLIKPDPAYYANEAICMLPVRDWLGLTLGPKMLSGYLNGPALGEE